MLQIQVSRLRLPNLRGIHSDQHLGILKSIGYVCCISCRTIFIANIRHASPNAVVIVS